MVAPADGNTRIQRPTTPSTPGPVEAPSRPEVAPPAHAPVASPSPATDGIHTVPETVTVRSGESLYLIAARHQIPRTSFASSIRNFSAQARTPVDVPGRLTGA